MRENTDQKNSVQGHFLRSVGQSIIKKVFQEFDGMKLLILPNIFGTEVLASSRKGCPTVGKN